MAGGRSEDSRLSRRPLHGDRQGQRVIRLSLAYRALSVVKEDEEGSLVRIEEASKHAY